MPSPGPLTRDTHSADDDPLLYLPCATVVECARSQIIYDVEDPCTSLYVVIAGTVQVSRLADGQPVIMDLCRTDDFFGEGALVRLPRRGEQAMALEKKTMLMTWQSTDVEDLMVRRPSLALAFLKTMARREMALTERLESLSRDSIAVRLARSLLRFSERLGTPAAEGTVRMPPFTHEFLAQYVGTSRELVNTCMTQFRREELLQYSRKEITLSPGAMGEWVRHNPRGAGVSEPRPLGTRKVSAQ